MQILVADNNDHTRNTICQLLENEGYSTIAAETASDALSLFRKYATPIIIVDLVLIGMDGLELLEKFKFDNLDCEVIALTSYPSLESVIGAMNHGALDYLVKTGEDLGSLVETVNRAAEKIREKIELQSKISELKSKIDYLENVNHNLTTSTRDQQTGFHNPSYFDEAFKSEIHRSSRNNRQFSIVVVRLNPSIQISGDQFQVRAIDTALPNWSKTIQDRLRKSDIVARYDDNVLSIILPETGKAGALLVAESLIQLCDEVTQVVLGEEIEIADLLQVGIASFPDDGDNKDKLFDLATKRSTDTGSVSGSGNGTLH